VASFSFLLFLQSRLEYICVFSIKTFCFIFHRYEAVVISGTEMAKQIQKEIHQGVESWIALGHRRPHLSIILVGDNPASHTYVRNKIKAASAVGGYVGIFTLVKYIDSRLYQISANCHLGKNV
uniref:Tetrahydrofolate dehydrogenase/cyclohydrolase catalytic domain-containing protein n=1 Tax=Spermophilus dauricus TaxID=99837 RepID=A0A8C9Q253_SPEDA